MQKLHTATENVRHLWNSANRTKITNENRIILPPRLPTLMLRAEWVQLKLVCKIDEDKKKTVDTKKACTTQTMRCVWRAQMYKITTNTKLLLFHRNREKQFFRRPHKCAQIVNATRYLHSHSNIKFIRNGTHRQRERKRNT